MTPKRWLLVSDNLLPNEEAEAIVRKVRLVVLLDAAEQAGLVPLPIRQLHTLAYLANVLAPVWNMPVLDGRLLKRRGGPFYPALQQDLDRLVGTGVVLITNLSHVRDENQRWRLEGSYKLNNIFSSPILTAIKSFKAEAHVAHFVQELAYALSSLSDEDIGHASAEDATYSDENVDEGNVLDFADWRDVNYSANAARRFEQLIPGGARATYGELLHLYVRHLHTRLHEAD